MWVKKIEIRNLRCFENLEIEFGRGINILVGKNNSGKSTIIKSLYNLQASHALTPEDIRKSKHQSLVMIHFENCVHADAFLFNLPQDAKIFPNLEKGRMLGIIAMFGGKTGVKTEKLFFPFDYSIHYDSGSTKIQVRNLAIKMSNAGTEFVSMKDIESEHNFIYAFLANRNTGSIRNSTSKMDIERANEIYQYLPAKIQRLSNPSNKKLHAKYREYCDKLLGFLPGIVSIDNNSSNLQVGCYHNNVDVIPITSMGDGVANILGLISVLLTENNKLILIEEIERDIHPEVLKELLELLIQKSSNNQIIISTHSHIVLKYLASVPDSKIFYIENDPYDKDDDFLPTASVEEIGNSPSARMKILRQLGYDLNDIDLFEAYLILEESSAEQIIREIIIPIFYPELLFKLRTIAANGVDDIQPRFNEFRRLFTFLHTTGEIYYGKAWVIADGDKPGKEVIKIMKESFSSWNSDHFQNWTKPNFEEYFPERFKIEVAKALTEKDKVKKRQLKSQLLKDVVLWTQVNKEIAKVEFAHSAGEVIRMLEQIRVSVASR